MRERWVLNHPRCRVEWLCMKPLVYLYLLSPPLSRITPVERWRRADSRSLLSPLGRYRPVAAGPPHHLKHTRWEMRSCFTCAQGPVSLPSFPRIFVSGLRNAPVSTDACWCYLYVFSLLPSPLLLYSEHRGNDETRVFKAMGAQACRWFTPFLLEMLVSVLSDALRSVFVQRGVTGVNVAHKGSCTKPVCREDAAFAHWSKTARTPVGK